MEIWLSKIPVLKKKLLRLCDIVPNILLQFVVTESRRFFYNVVEMLKDRLSPQQRLSSASAAGSRPNSSKLRVCGKQLVRVLSKERKPGIEV